MDRAAAIRLVRKLQALADPTRGGTPGERQVAAAKAARLLKRFGLTAADTRSEPARRVEPRPAYVAPVFGAAWVWGDWEFNVNTGAASSNVKVHHHRDAGNWKIEIFPRQVRDLPGQGRRLPGEKERLPK